jgi:selenide,water dikinase
VLSGLQIPDNDRVLVDFRTSDDAGVYQWDDKSALVQTVDFITPIIDDPLLYGQIAAANALSDVYAMGGQPLTALAIAGFPKKGLDSEVQKAIFKGGLTKLREANVALLGGHTVQDPEIKFGYSITGSIDVDRVLTNTNAQPGDNLLLTKPIGTGIVATAIKYGRAPESVIASTTGLMTTLNRLAAETLRAYSTIDVHACTDVTGFGLIGHASEMAAASNVTIHIDSTAVPLIEGVRELVERNRTAGGSANQDHFGSRVNDGIDDDLLALLYDPQTSGGLLVAVNHDRSPEVTQGLKNAGVSATKIGEVASQSDMLVSIS